MSENLYFDLAEPRLISDIGTLLALNVKKTYYRTGDTTPVDDLLTTASIPHSTAGIFRGQLYDWPLVPKCFRGIDIPETEIPRSVRSFRWGQATHKFSSFCERAESQNPTFPPRISDRMSIAQHFGVPTPLLDWSQNIFAAVFFAIRAVYADSEFGNALKVYIYHVIDEGFLHTGIPEGSDLADIAHSCFVKQYSIDKRIERQQAVFTFHPFPTHTPLKIPAKLYILEWPMIQEMIGLMRGLGFTEDYFFPDYAGIAHAVTYETSL